MKKRLLSLFIVAMGVSAYAQSDSPSWNGGTVIPGWNSVWVEWSPSTFNVDQQGADNQSFTTFSAGYSRAFNIATSKPLFCEVGLGVQHSFYEDDFQDARIDSEGNTYYYTAERSFYMWSAKVPVNILYMYDIPNSCISVIPFGGVNLRYNISAEQQAPGNKGYVFSEAVETDLFDSKDMGSSSNTWKRFLLGWNIGCKARFGKHIMASLSYGNDIIEVAKKTKISAVTVSVGYAF